MAYHVGRLIQRGKTCNSFYTNKNVIFVHLGVVGGGVRVRMCMFVPSQSIAKHMWYPLEHNVMVTPKSYFLRAQ
jgi:hypothetical protein